MRYYGTNQCKTCKGYGGYGLIEVNGKPLNGMCTECNGEGKIIPKGRYGVKVT